MTRVYLSLGSNLGDRAGYLRRALELLARDDLRITRSSGVYETAPLELADQPDFLNLVAEAETDLTPEQLLARTAEVEEKLNRQRTVPKGPRTVDIDVLLYGRMVVSAPAIEIPHPRMHLRRFVLEPLAELIPEFEHPVVGRRVKDLLEDVRDQRIRKIRPPLATRPPDR